MRRQDNKTNLARAAAGCAVLWAVIALTSGIAAASATWELRACAPPQSLPFSDRFEAGYENHIASIVADELGAELTYEWIPFTSDLVNLHFAEGTCDLILGVPDGFEQGLNTVAYYQSPYVMVYRADAGIDIESLDDPDLASLRIGVQGAGTPPQAALVKRGLSGNIHRVFGGSAGSDDRLAIMVEAVAAGEVDIGFGWGPAVAYWSERSDAELVVRPVTPEFEPPRIFQSVPMTMAVRRTDTALRDLLNRALAARWDEIQGVLTAYGVPLTPIPAPFAGGSVANPASVVIDVGVVLPAPTGGRTYLAAINDVIGQAALQGALFAEGQINAAAATTDTDMAVFHASAPSAEAAVRAAERLVTVHGVSALVGGVGHGQARALAAVAAEHGVAFLNVGSSDALLRRSCLATTFHFEPSPQTYFSALIDLARGSSAGDDAGLNWFVVHLDDDGGRSMLDAATAAIEAAGDTLTGSAAVVLNSPSYFQQFASIEGAETDAVMVVLPAAEQLTFMGQFEDAGGEAVLAPYPYPVTQTRNFLAASADYGVALEVPRLLAWETSLADGGAGELNRLFTSRWGQPMDPTAWTTFEALMALQQAAVAARAGDAEAVLDYLSRPGVVLDTAKGSLRFSNDNQLRQRVYAVKVNPDAEWGINFSDKIAVATLVRVIENEVPDGSTVCAD